MLKEVTPVVKTFYTSDEVAELFNVSKKTIYRMIKRGDIVPLPNLRHIRIAVKDIEQMIQESFQPLPLSPP